MENNIKKDNTGKLPNDISGDFNDRVFLRLEQKKQNFKKQYLPNDGPLLISFVVGAVVLLLFTFTRINLNSLYLFYLYIIVMVLTLLPLFIAFLNQITTLVLKQSKQ